MEWSSIAPAVVSTIFILAGILIHYVKSETKHNLRYDQLKEYVGDHENRIKEIETSKMQANGQSTYISRPEYLRDKTDRNKKCEERGEKIKEICSKIAEHDVCIGRQKS